MHGRYPDYDVLANADEIAITTFQPGWAYGSDIAVRAEADQGGVRTR
jgi:HSP20 family molecular chaperone IbpA